MEIKRTGAGGIPPVSTNKTGKAAGERFSTHAERIRDAAVPVGGAGNGHEISKADLRNPEKVEQLVNRHAGELVERASLDMGAQFSDADRTAMTEWLSADPVFRGKLMRYFEQIAK